MISENELLNAIEELEDCQVMRYDTCQKLATFYTLYHFLYEPQTMQQNQITKQTVVEVNKTSDFLELINGKDAGAIWAVIDELMESLEVLHPKIYNATMQKLKEI